MTSTTDNVLRRALEDLTLAAEAMPRETPQQGGSSTEHTFKIAACDVWNNDRAIKRAREALTLLDARASEFAWVIEKGDEPSYYAPTEPGEWVTDHLKACRFARKADAEAIQFRCVRHGPLPERDTRVCEHGWGLALAAPHPQGGDDWRAGVEAQIKRVLGITSDHDFRKWPEIERAIRNLQPPASVEAMAEGEPVTEDQRAKVATGNFLYALLAKNDRLCAVDPNLSVPMKEQIGTFVLDNRKTFLASLLTSAPHDQPGSPEREDREKLAVRIEGPLPQRVLEVDTGTKADEYRLSISTRERNLLIASLRTTPAPSVDSGK